MQSQVHRSLVAADNALGEQSHAHPDGWGVAYYVDEAPHLTRSEKAALGDQIFHRLSGVVASETVLAHVRKATVGHVSVLNCHPFQHGRWTFAHNGEIRNYEASKGRLRNAIAPRLRRYILGDTDSEAIFYLFLTHLSHLGPLKQRFTVEEAVQAISATVKEVRALCDGTDEADQALLTLLVTDGSVMVGTQGGKALLYSTHKTRCSDRDNCPSLSDSCEAPSESGFVNHLIFSSEEIAGDNVWRPLQRDEAIGVDWRMRLHVTHLFRRSLPIDTTPA